MASSGDLDWTLGAGELYWDPVPWIARLEGHRQLGRDPVLPAKLIFGHGAWEERNWRNVPGPIYGAMTDNCWVGRGSAPRHILYGGDDDYDQEFVYRQPRNVDELLDVLDGAWRDPCFGWACDGDEHWTLELVREWWRERARLEEWIQGKIAAWVDAEAYDAREAVVGLRDYSDYLRGDLEGHLRVYAFWLEERRSPNSSDALPVL